MQMRWRHCVSTSVVAPLAGAALCRKRRDWQEVPDASSVQRLRVGPPHHRLLGSQCDGADRHAAAILERGPKRRLCACGPRYRGKRVWHRFPYPRCLQQRAPDSSSLSLLALAMQLELTHAASRIDLRWPLLLSDAGHMLGAGVGIGGLPYFLTALNGLKAADDWRLIGRRFSMMSMASVAAIVFGGTVMALNISAPPTRSTARPTAS
jgi:hypothetical protein